MMGLHMRTFCLALALSTVGSCTHPTHVPERRPVRWVMVEKPAAQVLTQGQSGDGRVDAGARLLALHPLYREDLQWDVVVDPHDFFVEVVEISPGTSANPGEVVSAKVRVGRAKDEDIYRLTATASRSDVRLLSARELLVRGSAPAVFQFTSASAGAGGIAVAVERVPSDNPSHP